MTQIAMAFLVCSLLTLSSSAGAAVHRVDCTGGGDYLTIQEAVDAAADGDTILVAPCLYEEQVLVVGKALTFQGSGKDVTELAWAGSGATIDIEMPQWGIFAIRDMSITRDPESGEAVSWDDHMIVLERCDVGGGVGGGTWYGEAHVHDSRLSWLSVSGGMRQTVVRDSRIGRLSIGGIQFQAGNSLDSADSIYDVLYVGCMMSAESLRDSVRALTVLGGIDCYSEYSAEEATIDSVFGSRCPGLVFDRCELGDIVITQVWQDEWVDLSLTGCVVRGDVSVGLERTGEPARGGRSDPTGRDFYGFRLLHNTILGDVRNPLEVWDGWPGDARWVRGNIVIGETELYDGGHLVISHNDFVGGVNITAPGDSIYANISAEPLFCDPEFGDYTLQDCSPCLGAAHDGGDIGAFGMGCECDVAVEDASWGAIKHLFR